MFFSRVSHNVRLSLTSKWGQKFAPFPMAKSDVFSPFCVEKFIQQLHFDLKRQFSKAIQKLKHFKERTLIFKNTVNL